eukprot:TRINITY_DN432_c0_g5_i1.p1 TRINITY_DN432_c0_g5~~TRINITY_DN432_c0_g5_i1.p1  ORF type:complete len:142 (+),score=53.10 TRINITY_DN432_c0_g5_i1:88-513(+)
MQALLLRTLLPLLALLLTLGTPRAEELSEHAEGEDADEEGGEDYEEGEAHEDGDEDDEEAHEDEEDEEDILEFLDTDGDEMVSLEELMAVQQDPTEAGAAHMRKSFQKADANGDGLLDPHEFFEMTKLMDPDGGKDMPGEL